MLWAIGLHYIYYSLILGLIHEEEEKLLSVSVFEFGGKMPIDCIAEMCPEHNYGGTRDLACTHATWVARTYISRPSFSLGTHGHWPQVISTLAGDFVEILCIFWFFRGYHLILSSIRRQRPNIHLI